MVKLDASWVNNQDTLKVEKLKLVEYLRAQHNVNGRIIRFHY